MFCIILSMHIHRITNHRMVEYEYINHSGLKSWIPKAETPANWPFLRPILYAKMISNYINCWPEEVYEELIVDCRKFLDKTFIISSPEIVKSILKNSDGVFQPLWQQRRICRTLFGGSSIADAVGEEWAEDRKLFEDCVSRINVLQRTPLMAANARHAVDQVAQSPGCVDVSKIVTQYAQRNIVSFALSAGNSDEMDRLAHDLYTYRSRIGLVSIASFFRLGGLLPTRARGSVDAIRRMEQIVRLEQQSRAKSTGPVANDLLGRYEAHRAQRASDRASEKRAVSNVMALLASGIDTTASAIGWVVYMLAAHPQAQSLVRKELRAARGEEELNLAHLPICRQVIQETLRLYPSLPLLGRVASEQIVINGFRIDRGSSIFISPYIMHRHRALWQEPDAFDHERFAPHRRDALSKGAYIPFGAGQRSCVGSQLANQEIIAFLRALIVDHEIGLVEGHNVTLRSGLGLHAQGGIMIKARAIHPEAAPADRMTASLMRGTGQNREAPSAF